MLQATPEMEALKSRIRMLGTVRNVLFGGSLAVLGLQIFGHVGGLRELFWVLLAGSFITRMIRQTQVSKYVGLIQEARGAAPQ